MNKRGIDANGVVITLVLVIAAFLVISTVIAKIFLERVDDTNAAQACRTANVIRANTQLDKGALGFSFEQSLVPSVCKTQEKILSADTRQVLMGQISELAADCWSQWVNGYYSDLLCDNKGQSFGGNVGVGGCDNSVCFTCSTFTYEQIRNVGSKPGEPGYDATQRISAAELVNFMRTETFYVENPRSGLDTTDEQDATQKPIEVTYLDYFQFDNRGSIFFGFNKKDLTAQDDTFWFEPQQVYTISYLEPYKDKVLIPGHGGDNSKADNLGHPAIYIEAWDKLEDGACNIKYGIQGN